MSNPTVMVVAKNEETGRYYIVHINEYRLTSEVVSYERIKTLAIQNAVINYKFNQETNEVEYTQGSESRIYLDSKSDNMLSEDRLFIIERLVKDGKTLGFSVLLVGVDKFNVDNKSLWRINYHDTLKLMSKYTCINAKKSDIDRKISALKGNFRERETRSSQYKPNKTLVNNVMNSVSLVSQDDNIKGEQEISDKQRLKEYTKLYSDFMIAPDGDILKQYAEEPTIKLIGKQIKGRYGRNIKRALAIGLALAAVGGPLANMGGIINFMPENRIEVNKTAEKPTSKSQSIAMLEAADKITVDYDLNWSKGTVYADGVEVAVLSNKLVSLLDGATLLSLDGDTIASGEQKWSLMGKFELDGADGEETTINGKYSMFKSRVVQKDKSGNILSEASLGKFARNVGYILDSKGNKCYKIVKEPFGKTFSIEKMTDSSMNNTDAVMITSLLSIKANNDTHSSNSSSSKSK